MLLRLVRLHEGSTIKNSPLSGPDPHYAFPSVSLPALHSTGHNSPVCSALSTRNVSSMLRPTRLQLIDAYCNTPSGSMINVPRSAMPSSSIKTLYAADTSCVMSDKSGVLSSPKSLSQALWLCTESVEHPYTTAFSASNSSYRFENPVISVGQIN